MGCFCCITNLVLVSCFIISVVHSAALKSDKELLFRQQELARLKQRILEGLGLTKIPDVSKMNVSREEYERMYRVYLQSVDEQRRREEEDSRVPAPTTPPQRFYSFPHTPQAGSNSVRLRRDTTWLYFPMDVSEREGVVEVSSASLRLSLTWPLTSLHQRRHSITLRVYQVLRPEGEEPERLLIDQKEVKSDSAGTRWVELDVRRAAENWLQERSSNLGLELECRGCSAFGASINTEDSSVSPTLNVLTTSQLSQRGRGRRSIDIQAPTLRRTNCSSSGERCCRHSMEVVFKELEDFEFILQPTKYDAGFCKGRCPPRYNAANYHALIQSLVWKRDRSMAPRPCCAPSKLKSLQMLVLDADDPTKLRVVNWTQMEVEECSCT